MASYHGRGTVPSWESFETEGGEDEVDNSEYAFAGRDHILFCIDASESMHTPFADKDDIEGKIRGRSALQQALEAIERIQRSKVITGPMDSVGVLLWNVDSSQAPPSTAGTYKSGTYVYQPIRQINPEEIKRLVDINKEARDQIESQDGDEALVTTEPDILRETFPPVKKEDEMNIADVLSTCNFLFRDAGTTVVGAKRVFLITDVDEPPGSSHNRSPAKTIFGDLQSYGIDLIPFFISRPEHQFDSNLYWNDILKRAPEEVGEYDGLQELTDMINDLVIKYAPKRVVFNVPLKLGKGGDITIGVSGYALVSAVNKGQPKLVYMRGRQTEEVIVKTEYTSAETGAVLGESELSQAYKFGNEKTVQNVLEPNWWEADNSAGAEGLVNEALRLDKERRQREDEEGSLEEEEEEEPEEGEDGDVAMKEGLTTMPSQRAGDKQKIIVKTRIQFKSDEVAQFKSLGLEPQIKIIGFQGSNHLHPDENIKHAYFIYPNEREYTGSTRTFAALLLSCTKHDRHALALCRFRTNTAPEFCVLIPQPEVLNDDGSQDMPPGFHVIPLPYKDDLRSAPKQIRANLTATEDQVKMMGTIIRSIKAKSYDSDNFPNPALAYHFDQLQALAFGEDWDPDAPEKQHLDKTKPRWGKIHATAGEFMEEWNRLIEEDERAVVKLAAPSKRAVKAVVDIDEENLLDIPGMWKKGAMDKLKLQELKDWAKFHRVSLTGKTKKADIIDVLGDWLEKHSSEIGKKSKACYGGTLA